MKKAVGLATAFKNKNRGRLGVRPRLSIPFTGLRACQADLLLKLKKKQKMPDSLERFM